MDEEEEEEEEKQGFGPVIGCHRMGEKGEDDRGRKGRMGEEETRGEVDSEMRKSFQTAW